MSPSANTYWTPVSKIVTIAGGGQKSRGTQKKPPLYGNGLKAIREKGPYEQSPF